LNALLQTSLIVANAFFLIVILKSFNLSIKTKDGIYISVLTTIGNYFTPFKGGMGIRAVYLKKKYKLSYTKFLSSLAGNYILIFFINSIVALCGTAILLSQGKHIATSLILIFLGLFLSLLIIIVFPVPTGLLKKIQVPLVDKFISRVILVIDGWNIISRDWKTLSRLMFLTFITIPLTLLLYIIEFKSLGIEISFLNVLLFSSISSIAFLISITPGSLGIKEAILILFQTTLLLDTSEILAVSIIDRVVTFFVMIMLWVVIKLYKSNILNSRNTKKTNDKKN